LDKVKAQAQTVAQQGQGKLSSMQGKKHTDSLLLELGGIVYCQRQGRPGTPGEDRISQIMTQVQQLETEHGAVTITPATGGGQPGGGFVPAGGGVPVGQQGGMGQQASAVPQQGYQPQSFQGGIPQSGGFQGGVPQSGGFDPNAGGIPQSGGFDPNAGGIPQSGGMPEAAEPEAAGEESSEG
jgi:hypothetical protein